MDGWFTTRLQLNIVQILKSIVKRRTLPCYLKLAKKYNKPRGHFWDCHEWKSGLSVRQRFNLSIVWDCTCERWKSRPCLLGNLLLLEKFWLGSANKQLTPNSSRTCLVWYLATLLTTQPLFLYPTTISGTFIQKACAHHFNINHLQCQKSGKETIAQVQTMNHTLFYYNNRENY